MSFPKRKQHHHFLSPVFSFLPLHLPPLLHINSLQHFLLSLFLFISFSNTTFSVSSIYSPLLLLLQPVFSPLPLLHHHIFLLTWIFSLPPYPAHILSHLHFLFSLFISSSFFPQVKDERKLREQEDSILRRDVERLGTKYTELRDKMRTMTGAAWTWCPLLFGPRGLFVCVFTVTWLCYFPLPLVSFVIPIIQLLLSSPQCLST